MKWSLLNRYYNISFKKNIVFFVAKYVLECVSLIWHHDLFDAVSSTAWTQWPWQCQRISSRDVYGDHQKSYQEIIDPCLSIESSTITTCHKEPWKLFLEIVSCRNSTYQSSEPRNWSRLVAKKQFDSMASCDHVWCLCLLHLYIYIYIHAATSMCIRYMIMAIHELLLLFDLMTTTMLPKSSCFSPIFFSSTIKARLSWTSRVGKIGNGDHLKDPLENNRNTTNHQICLGREGVPNS